MTDDEIKYFAAINFSEYFGSWSEKLYWKLSEKQNLRKVAESLHIFLTIPDEVEKYVKIMQSSSSDKYVDMYICTNIEVFLIPNYNWSTLKQIKKIAKWAEKG